MVGGAGHSTAAMNQAVNTSLDTAGPGGAGGLLNSQKDAKESSTAPKFGEVFQQIQAKYGAKAEKPREIKKTLGKDDFLKIMITQMKFQDPTNPFKPEQMAQEMAQFTSVEQLQNVNQNLAKMANQNTPLERLAMTNMIGKVVTVDRDRFSHTEGASESLGFNLPRDAASAKITLVSDAGEAVWEKDLGPLKAGEQSVPWDGKKVNTLPAKAGTYSLNVQALDEQGNTIQTQSQAQARVIGVSFEGAEPVFLVGDARHQEKVTLRNVVRIDADPAGPGAMAAASLPTGQGTQAGGSAFMPAAPAATAPKTNFIAFEKGKGSSNLASEQLSPEAAAAIARYQQELAQRGPAGGEGKGFPNGLQDSDESGAPHHVSSD